MFQSDSVFNSSKEFPFITAATLSLFIAAVELLYNTFADYRFYLHCCLRLSLLCTTFTLFIISIALSLFIASSKVSMFTTNSCSIFFCRWFSSLVCTSCSEHQVRQRRVCSWRLKKETALCNLLNENKQQILKQFALT